MTERLIVPRALSPVSPRMKDGDVVDVPDDVSGAHELLFRNHFGPKDPEDGGGEFYHLDEPQHRDDQGRFGARSGKAAQKARYFLGYPKRGADGWRRERFDQRLADFLTGEKKLPAPYRRRRHRRLKRQEEGGLGAKALQWAKDHPDRENPPGSNKCETTRWYGFVGAWCLMWVTRCYVMVGSKVFVKGVKWAYNPTLYHMVKAGLDGAEFVPLKKARPGDSVHFDWNDGTEPPDHAALFMRIEGDEVITLDGNWNSISGIQRHPISAVMCVIRFFE